MNLKRGLYRYDTTSVTELCAAAISPVAVVHFAIRLHLQNRVFEPRLGILIDAKSEPDGSPRLCFASHSSPLPTMMFSHLSLPAAIVLLVTGYLLFVRWLLSLMGRSATEKTSS